MTLTAVTNNDFDSESACKTIHLFSDSQRGINPELLPQLDFLKQFHCRDPDRLLH
jgi:hypothetical protein